MIHEDVLAQLADLEIDPVRPMLVVDVDEVLVGLAGHLGTFAETQGFSLRLTGYQLDGALKRADGSTASQDEFRQVFTEFFETQTRHQVVYPHAADVLSRAREAAQIVILTNVPDYAADARIENLRGHDIDFPMIVNRDGKGRVLARLASHTEGKVVFIDDSPGQIGSAAKHAPDVMRIHFVGDDHLRGLTDPVPHAHHAPDDWRAIEAILADVFEAWPR